MSITWFVIAMIVLLHTAWTLANAITNKDGLVKGPITPHNSLPYVWGAVVGIAAGQMLFLLLFH